LTGSLSCAELRSELGVYLVGAIAPEGRHAVENHLASCSSCRDQLAQLAGLPALLRRVPSDEVDSLAPACCSHADRPGEDGTDADNPAEDSTRACSTGGRGTLPETHLAALLNRAARRRRRARSQLAVAAAAGLALGAGSAAGTAAALGTATNLGAAAGAPPGAITVRGSNPSMNANAVVVYAARPWGVQLSVRVTGVAAGTTCVLEVTGADGREWEAGSWTVAAHDEDAWYQASSSVPAISVRGFVVTSDARALVNVGARRLQN
jgi:predicted anti-sigma-YlaC factor YlaD